MASGAVVPRAAETKWQDKFTIEPELAKEKTSGSVGFWKIAFAVFVGNLLTAIVVSVIYAANH
jgi:hypothetical protein